MPIIVPDRGSNILGKTTIAFSFVGNGTNAVDQTTIRGSGVTSVAYAAATGKFTVTLDSAFFKIVSARAGVFLPDGTTPAGNIATHAAVSFPSETAAPLVLTVWAIKGDGTPVDTTYRVWVELTIQASSGA